MQDHDFQYIIANVGKPINFPREYEKDNVQRFFSLYISGIFGPNLPEKLTQFYSSLLKVNIYIGSKTIDGRLNFLNVKLNNFHTLH